jgi:mono/diheme cytochrome c family protein
MRVSSCIAVALVVTAVVAALADGAPPKAPVRITMEELHRHGGVPPGWRFNVPSGDPSAGRTVFAKLECHKCHAIAGERFTAAGKRDGDVGPDLTGMGKHHSPAYFLESILNPNAVIVTGPGYTSEDGLSVMPDYSDSLTVRELIDLVAYIQHLDGEHEHPSASGHGDLPAGRTHGEKPETHGQKPHTH